MTRMFTIYQKLAMSMSDEESDTKEYMAVPTEYLSTGLFIPASHPEIDRNEVGEVEANSADEAVTLFREKGEDSYM